MECPALATYGFDEKHAAWDIDGLCAVSGVGLIVWVGLMGRFDG
jgi:hypothetical protein